MATKPGISAESVNKLLLVDGFFVEKDLTLGDEISELEKRAFKYDSEYGLGFCERHVLNEVSFI